jgi:hypothetical protein
MATLTGQSIANSYKDLLQVSNSNNGIDATSRLVSDGEGTDSILYLSTGKVGVGKTPDTKFAVNLDTNKNLNFSASYMGNIAGILARNDGNDTMADLGLAGSTIRFSVDGTNDAMKLDSNGNFGIGISTLETPFDITPRLQVEGTTASTSSISLFRNSDNTSPPYLILGKSKGTSVNSDTGVALNDVLGHILFVGADGTDRHNAGAEIFARVDGSAGSNDLPTELVFGTTVDGGTEPTERMRITSAGNVGIGNIPEVPFHIKLADTATARIEDTSTDGIARLEFKNDARESTVGLFGNSSDDFLIGHGGGTVIKIDVGQVTTFTGDVKLSKASGSTTQSFVPATGQSSQIQFFQDDGSTQDARIFAPEGATKLAFEAGTTEMMRMSSTGIGIGTALPDTNLHIFKADASATAHSDAQLAVENSGVTAINLLSGATSHGQILFGDDEDADKGVVGYDQSTDKMYIRVNGSADKSFIIDVNSRISLSNNGGEATNTIFGYQAGNTIHSSSGMNTFIGHQVADTSNHADADENTAVGYLALSNLTSGAKNISIGSYSGINITSGDENVLIGRSAGNYFNSSDLVAVGTATLASINDANCDGTVAVGYQALTALTEGIGNTALGYQSADSLTTSGYNTAVGYQALSSEVQGTHNVALGYQALFSQNKGSAVVTGNIGIGVEAGYHNDTGVYNVLIGYKAGTGVDGNSNSNNVGIGFEALNGVEDGSQNTAVGKEALKSVTSGQWNTGLGDRAGDGITTGNANICIGTTSDVVNTGSSQIAIGNGATVSGGNGIAIGEVTASGNNFSFGKSGNVVTNDFTTNALWNRSSDIRKKKNIKDANLGLEFINDLRTVTFQWKPSEEHPEEWKNFTIDEEGKKVYAEMNTDIVMHGMIAQEVKKALDKCGIDTFGGWGEDSNGCQTLSIEMFVLPLIKAVQELSAKVTELESKLK